MDATEAHQAMGKAGASKARADLKSILLATAQLYEALRGTTTVPGVIG
jgi:hypothetical protein